jgi:glutathione S-transferase
VPILAFGRDIYVDTALITEILESKFPEPTIFPPRKGSGVIDKGLQKRLLELYADKFLAPLGFAILPWLKAPKALQEDRMKVSGKMTK